MQLGQADKYCGKAHGLGSRFVGFCNPIWICNWIKQIHSKVKSVQLQYCIVPILLNKEVWTKLGSCYKVQGGAGMILSPVPCYGGARPLHNVWTQYTASWRGSVIITMVLLWWGMVVCRHSRQYQTCEPYLTMFGMRTIIGDAFTSYKLGPSHF